MNNTFLLTLLFLLSNTLLSAQCPRQQVVDDYNNLYLTADFNTAELAWTGSTANCTAGIMSTTVRNKHLQKVNYYRKLVGGLTTNITTNSTKNAKCMETVLMLKAANQLSHCTGTGGSPCNTFPCNTPNAIEGAQRSNLAGGGFAGIWNSLDPIDMYIEDSGSSNIDVGHRRWVLYSSLVEIGLGTNSTHNAMLVIGDAASTPTYNQFIAYPPNGYIPQALVFPRWSFSLPGNWPNFPDFTNATVTMTNNNGAGMGLNIVARNGGFGDRSIVWEPSGVITNSTMDLTYTVTISGITNAPQTSYTYQVKIVPPVFPPNCPTGEPWNNSTCSCGTPTPTACNNQTTTISTNVTNQTINNADKIITTGNVSVSGTVNFQAFIEVTMNSGFQVNSGNNFTATIIPCNVLQEAPVMEFSRTFVPSLTQINLIEPPLKIDQPYGTKLESSFTNETKLSLIPNPVSTEATIEIQLANTEVITLDLFDINGRRLKSLIPLSSFQKGTHQVFVSAKELRSGVYYISLQSNTEKITKKIVVH